MRTTTYPGLFCTYSADGLQFSLYSFAFFYAGLLFFSFVFHSRARSRAPKAEDSHFFQLGGVYGLLPDPAAHRLPDKTPAPTHPRLRGTPTQEDRNNGYIAGPATRSTSRAAIYPCQQAFPQLRQRARVLRSPIPPIPTAPDPLLIHRRCGLCAETREGVAHAHQLRQRARALRPPIPPTPTAPDPWLIPRRCGLNAATGGYAAHAPSSYRHPSKPVRDTRVLPTRAPPDPVDQGRFPAPV